MKSKRRGTVLCDKCSKEIFLKKATIRFPVPSNGEYYFFCDKCAESWDKKSMEIKVQFDHALHSEFQRWIKYV